MAYQVKAIINLETDFLAETKRRVNTSHGMSMLALAMLELRHVGLNVTLTFEDIDTLENCAEQMTAIWDRCESNRVLFRSVKKDGAFLKEYFDRPLSEETTHPTSPDEYKLSKIILDADMNANTHVYKFYRTNEQRPRLLTLKC